ETPQPLALMFAADPQPRQHSHRKHPLRQALADLRGEVSEIHLTCREGVVPRNCPGLVEKDLRYREVLFLILEGFCRQPVVNLFLPTSKPLARVLAAEALQPEAIGKPDAVHVSPRIREPSRC